jgi:hypothetical protein
MLSLDFQVLALGCRAHRLYHATDKPGLQKWAELVLIVAIAAALAYVSLQMHSIFARVTGASVSIEVGQAQLGINPIHLIWERSALVMVLIFMSGWLRGSQQQGEQGEQGQTVPAVPPAADLSDLIERLDERYAQRMQTTIETITEILVERTIERVTVAQLPGGEQGTNAVAQLSAPDAREEPVESVRGEQNRGLAQRIEALYKSHPNLTNLSFVRINGRFLRHMALLFQ